MRPTAADAWAMYSWLIEGRELRAIDHSDDPPDLKYKEKMRLLRDAIRKRGVEGRGVLYLRAVEEALGDYDR